MAETIGTCINHSDKSEIDQIISKNIDELDINIKRTRINRQKLIEFGTNVEELNKRYEAKKLKLKQLLLRVRNTPDCR